MGRVAYCCPRFRPVAWRVASHHRTRGPNAHDEVRTHQAESDREADDEAGEGSAEVAAIERVGEHLPQQIDHDRVGLA